MARIVLFVLAAVGIGTLTYGLSTGDKAHTMTQQRALVRETLDDAVAMILDKAIHPDRREWKAASPYSAPFDVNGYAVELTSYQLEDDGQVAAFTLVATVGGAVVEQTSRYLIEEPGWPGPLWFDTPVAVAEVHADSRIDGATALGTSGAIYDATRFNDYRLDQALTLNTIAGALSDSLDQARGTLAPLTVHNGTAALLDEYDAPSPTEIVGKALSEFDTSSDIRLAGPAVIADERAYGGASDGGATRIVHVPGDLTISSTGDLTGAGILVVEGDFIVRGRLRWDGLIVVRTQEQTLDVDMEQGDVLVRGGLVIDQKAPPPGGHTDMTIYRQLSGSWSPMYGESGAGTPGMNRYVDARSFYDHHHRLDFQIPEQRTFYFAEQGTDRHEKYTWFRRSLTDISTRYPGEDVYVRFRNHSNHGASLFHLVADGGTYNGAVLNGFGSSSRAGDRWASPSFAPADLDTLVVDVQSLRMLAHLTNGEEPTSPYWGNPGTVCQSRAECLGWLADRDRAMTVQIVRDLTDDVLYEAAIYWHTQSPGAVSGEFEQEQAAEAAWRQSIQNGTASYGAKLKMGASAQLVFNRGKVAQVLSRLRFNALRLVHIGSFVDDHSSHTPTGPSPPTGTPPPTSPPTTTPSNPTDPNGSGTAIVCHNGSEQTISRSRILTHIFHGDTVGGCADDPPPNGSPNNIVVCHNGSSNAVRFQAYQAHLNHGDTLGSCR